jgi:hypothetical protein
MVDNGIRNDPNTCSMASIDHFLELLSVSPLGDDSVGYRLSEGVLINNMLTCSLLAYLIIGIPGIALDVLLRRGCCRSVRDT